MSMPNNKRMGERPMNTGTDNKAQGLNSRMCQGATVRIPLKCGLTPMMGQGPRPNAGKGKWRKSANAAINTNV
jgi:hypothetical protein